MSLQSRRILMQPRKQPQDCLLRNACMADMVPYTSSATNFTSCPSHLFVHVLQKTIIRVICPKPRENHQQKYATYHGRLSYPPASLAYHSIRTSSHGLFHPQRMDKIPSKTQRIERPSRTPCYRKFASSL